MKTTETDLVFSDLHVPFTDSEVWALACGMVRRVKPRAIHLLGDVLDFDQLSRFLPKSGRAEQLQSDLDEAQRLIGQLQKLSPKSKIVVSEGNHEYRLDKYLRSRGRELESLRELSVPCLLKLREAGVMWKDRLHPYRVGGLWLTHGSLIRKHSAYTARAMMEMVGGNVLFGHTHRLGVHHYTTWNTQYVAYENGCMCRTDLDYLDGVPNWQHGWSVITTVGEKFSVEQVQVVDRKWYIYRGELYAS